jgi:hypothetical protein
MFKKEMLGGAHGLFGVLQMLLQFAILNQVPLLQEEEFLEKMKFWIKASISTFLEHTKASLHFPTKFSKHRDDDLV